MAAPKGDRGFPPTDLTPGLPVLTPTPPGPRAPSTSSREHHTLFPAQCAIQQREAGGTKGWGLGKMGERKGHGQVGSILRLQVRKFGKKTERCRDRAEG